MEALPSRTGLGITRRLRALAQDPRPHGAVKLAGLELWRIRIGDFRVIYQILQDELVVLVVKVGHRRDVYRVR